MNMKSMTHETHNDGMLRGWRIIAVSFREALCFVDDVPVVLGMLPVVGGAGVQVDR